MWDQAAFWADVEKTAGCWIWRGFVDNRGVARTLTKHGAARPPALAAWELYTGMRPAVRTIHQLCHNPLCVRREHLCSITSKEHLIHLIQDHTAKTGGDDCWLWQGPKQTHSGYGIVSIRKKHHVAHRLVYELAFGTLSEEIQVCHKCDNPPCVRIDHLFPGTGKDNSDDKVQKGRQAKGTRITSAKVTEADVREIRRLRNKGVRLKEIADRFGLKTESAVHGIATGRLWKHVEEPTAASQPLGFNGPRNRAKPIPSGSRWKGHTNKA